MKKDLSIILPSIRPKNLKKWYDSACSACKKYTWEVIIISPYDLPNELDKIENIKFVKSYANPTVCKQMAALFACGEYILIAADDTIYFSNSIDNMVDLWKENNLGKFDSVNCRYREGCLDAITLEPIQNPKPEFPLEYWTAHHHSSLRLSYIDKNWKISLLPLLLRDTFYELGGLETIGYEYSALPILELNFRMQKLGGKILDSINEVCWVSHSPGITLDHAPVHFAMEQNDLKLFTSRFSRDIINDILFLNYNSWRENLNVWERRFGDKIQ